LGKVQPSKRRTFEFAIKSLCKLLRADLAIFTSKEISVPKSFVLIVLYEKNEGTNFFESCLEFCREESWGNKES
jgi:hypothetical protein